MYYENINIGQQWYSKNVHSLKLFSGKYPELWCEKKAPSEACKSPKYNWPQYDCNQEIKPV